MRRYILRSVLCALVFTMLGHPVALHAQASITGKYVGGYTQNTQPPYRIVGLTLVISNVEGDAVKGSVAVNGGYCPGDYIVEGTYIANVLDVKSTSRPNRLGCDFKFTGKFEGNRINGNVEGNDVHLRK